MKTMDTNEMTRAMQYKSDIAKLLDVLEMEVPECDSVCDLFDLRRKLVEMVSCWSGHSEETVSKFCEE